MIGRREADQKIKKLCLATEPATIFVTSPGYPLSGCSPAEPDSVSPDGCNIASANLAAKLENNYFSYRKEQVGNSSRVTRLSGLPSLGAARPQGTPALVSRNPGQEYSEKSPIQPIRCSPVARHSRQKPGAIRGGTVPVCTRRRAPTQHPAS